MERKKKKKKGPEKMYVDVKCTLRWYISGLRSRVDIRRHIVELNVEVRK